MQQFSGLRLTIFVICIALGAGTSAITNLWTPLVIGALVGLYLLYAVRVVRQWEKIAVLRFGRYIGLREPGMFFMIPVVDTLSQVVDQRVRVTSVSAESTLTRDTVPVNVDAIVFWVVWNAEKSILEVQNFVDAITLSAQTALRESIGRHELAQMITERESMGRELQKTPRRKNEPMGHHRAVGRNPRRHHPASPSGRHVAPGPSRARTPGPHHLRRRRSANRREIR
jgi:hypothetical protein